MIELTDITFHYAEHCILDIPQWSVSQGEHVFIHGSSGCGKSTLLNIISGLLQPTTGQITVAGQALHLLSSRQRDRFRAKSVGYVFQQFNLIPYLSAYHNLTLASRFFKTRVKTASQMLSALNISPQDQARPVRQLSIGQQQRVAIARSLINQPAILIADEPTSSLDHTNQKNFMNLLFDVMQDTTLVFVSHDLSLAHYFTRVVPFDRINTR